MLMRSRAALSLLGLGLAAAAVAPVYVCPDTTATTSGAVSTTDSSGEISAPWTCAYEIYGCGDNTADNYASYVTTPITSMCSFAGCNDTEAKNFDSDATFNDGSCVYYKWGCTDPTSPAYSSHFDGSCQFAHPPPSTLPTPPPSP